MCKIAICEDEKVQVEKICEILKKFELNEGIKLNVDTFSSGEELIENKFEKYDIVFLDIKMKKLTGIETYKIIRKSSEKIKIIFITALEQYWPEGYTVSAYRYILKPIKEDELYSIIKDLINEINKNKRFILLKKDGAIEKGLISDIKYLGIENRKVVVYTINGVYSTSISLGEWESKLYGYDFAKPHSSYLVNFKYIKQVNKNHVVLTDEESVHVSQRKYKEFKDKFIKYINEIR